jgi:hypothetical protein
MRCLRFESIIAVFLMGCASEYAHLQKTQNDRDCTDKILPLTIETSWYDASVDVMGKTYQRFASLSRTCQTAQEE